MRWQKTESGWRQTEEPAPGQKEPDARNHDSAAEAATPARGAPLEPAPATPPTEEQAAKRAAQLERLAALPEHLRLGVTLAGMRALLSELPSDKLEQVNAHVEKGNAEREKKGKPTYPENETFNGYCNQHWITKWAKEAKEGQPEGDRLAVCERLRKQGSPHVGEATHFVSWFLATPIETLLDALGCFIEQKGLREEDTYFWVCDYVIRQTDVEKELMYLGECVSAVGHTVLMMEPWYNPLPLTRAYCITEVYHTQKSGAQFDVVMSSEQQTSFQVALVEDFDTIKAGFSKVDVRQVRVAPWFLRCAKWAHQLELLLCISQAECRNEEDQSRILSELEQGVGFAECNTLVIGLLREALVAQGRAALARLPEAERGTSLLLSKVGEMLMVMGRLEEARPMFEEAMQACKDSLGDRHPTTLLAMYNMGELLRAMGKLEEARPLLEESLKARRETLGDRHPQTLNSIDRMGGLLKAIGKLEEARPLYEEVVQAAKETLGDRNPDTLGSINNMGLLLQAMGKLDEARPLFEEALQGYRETLGDRHPYTLTSIDNMGSLLMGMGKLDEAKSLYEEALQAKRETLGDRHPDTLISIYNMGLLLEKQGKIGEATPLFTEELEGCVLLHGMAHKETLGSARHMVKLLRNADQQDEAEALAARYGV